MFTSFFLFYSLFCHILSFCHFIRVFVSFFFLQFWQNWREKTNKMSEWKKNEMRNGVKQSNRICRSFDIFDSKQNKIKNKQAKYCIILQYFVFFFLFFLFIFNSINATVVELETFRNQAPHTCLCGQRIYLYLQFPYDRCKKIKIS